METHRHIVEGLYFFVLRHPGCTKRDAQIGTGLSWGSVSSGVNGLVEKKILQAGDVVRSSGPGPRSSSLYVDPSHFVTLGLDLNREGLQGVELGLDGKVIHRKERPLEEKTKDAFLKNVESLFSSLIAKSRKEGREPFAIGLAVQGRVNPEKGLSCYFPDFEEGEWKDVPLCELIAKKFSLPVLLQHDPQCLLYEQMAETASPNAVLVRLDKGIGMACSRDGLLQQGEDAFELGHTIVVLNGRKCVCGNHGCLEAYASLRGLSQEANVPVEELLAHSESYASNFEEAGRYLGLSFYNVHRLLQNEEFILCGDMLKAKDFFFPVLCETMDSCAGYPLSKVLGFRFVEANAAKGAAMLAKEKFIGGILE